MSQEDDNKTNTDVTTTIDLAKMAREEQENYEMEVCFGQEEADLHRHYNSCNKNPGHTGFIPAKEFSIEHLDPSWRHPYIYETIQLLSQRTVRLMVRGASDARPSNFPFSGRQFRNARRYGTGISYFRVKNLTNSPCTMPNCNISEAHDEYGPITIETAAHVVFDKSEAKKTTVQFFFDGDDKSGIMTARVTDLTCSNVRLDRANLVCFTHDKMLIDKISEFQGSAREFIARWKNQTTDKFPSGITKLAAIVSHPHGMSKHITLGSINLDDKNAHYETSTCPGSSGAPVLHFVDFKEEPSAVRDLPVLPAHYIHSRVGDKGLNKASPTGISTTTIC